MLTPKKLLSVFSAGLLLFSITTPAVSAQIQINEFMANPVSISDGNGEWIELYNSGTEDVDLTGWELEIDEEDTHTLTLANATNNMLTIEAGGYYLLCRNTNQSSNGGVNCDYDWASISLTNSAGSIALNDDEGAEIDAVSYDNTNASAADNTEPGASSNVERDEDGNITSLTAEDTATYGPEADDTDVEYGTPANNTVVNETEPHHRYSSLQEAIDDAEDGDTIVVSESEDLDGTLTVDKPLTLTRLESASPCSIVLTGTILITGNDVIIEKLAITNPSGDNAIIVEGDKATISNNCIKNIGTDGTSGNVQGIYISQTTGTPLQDITIKDNTIENLASTTLSTKGILVEKVENLVITGNVIRNIESIRGGYGILVNRESDGILVNLNVITNINGDWVHAVSLDDDTYNVTVNSNTITDLTAVNLASAGVFIEDDLDTSDTATIVISGNQFSSLDLGVLNKTEAIAENLVNARGNWWAASSGPADSIANDASMPASNNGTGVGVFGAVDYRNWVGSEAEEPTEETPAPDKPQPTTPIPTPIQTASFNNPQPTTFTSPTTNSNVESDTDTPPQTSSDNDQQPEEQTTEPTPNEDDSTWLDQNWFFVLIVIFGGSAFWYYFVRPDTEV